MNGRPSIAAVMMATAQVFAMRSTCSRSQVGAIIELNGRIISTGYNGAPSGMPHCPPIEKHNKPCLLSIHAEANAIAAAARQGIGTEGAWLYTTLGPCAACAGLIINAGITTVVYRETYRNTDGLDLLRAGNVSPIWIPNLLDDDPTIVIISRMDGRCPAR